MQANEFLIDDDCWQTAGEEFARIFGIAQIKGIFRKALRVPVGCRAFVLQAGQANELAAGEYELEGFFSRLNHLLRDQAADIILARQGPCTLQFNFDDLPSAEFLPLHCSLGIAIKIEHIQAFARHFMPAFADAPGSITRHDLQALFAPAVRQVLAEFVGAQALPEMLANPDLRLQLDERLHSMLSIKLGQYGLALLQVDSMELKHEKLDSHKKSLGQLSLLLTQKNAQMEMRKQFAEMYEASEWQQINQQREQAERALQKMQLDLQLAAQRQEQEKNQKQQAQSQRQQEQIDENLRRAELSLQEQEKLQAMRSRKIELLGRILTSNNEEQALALHAKEALRELQHSVAGKAMARLDTVQGWQQMRALAEISMQTELDIARQEAQAQAALQKQGFSLKLAQLRQQATLQANRANLEQRLDNISLQAERRAEFHRQQRQAAQIEACERQLQQQRLQTRHILRQLQMEARQRQAQRTQDWEQELHLQQQRALLRDEALHDAQQQLKIGELQQELEQQQRIGTQQATAMQQEKLRATLAIQAQFEQQQLALQQQQQNLALEQRAKELHMRQQEQEQEWQRRLTQQSREQEERSSRWQAEQSHALELARLEMTKIGLLGNLDDMSKLAVAAPANAALLAEVMKTRLHTHMQAEQINASQGGISAQQQAEMQEQERQRREQMLADERQQQLALLAHQGKNLNSQQNTAQEASQRICAQGHANPLTARFCAQCGQRLSA